MTQVHFGVAYKCMQIFKLGQQSERTPLEESKINLAPKDPFYESLFGRVATWALSIGRYLVIFTELVVILSFLSRFQLDRQVTDLNSSILAKQRTIESYGALEQNVRDVQRKIDVYEQLQPVTSLEDVFAELSTITPNDIQYISLNIRPDAVLITARATTLNSLNRFIVNLQSSTFFGEVISNTISNTDQRGGGLDFQIEAQIAQTKSQTSENK